MILDYIIGQRCRRPKLSVNQSWNVLQFLNSTAAVVINHGVSNNQRYGDVWAIGHLDILQLGTRHNTHNIPSTAPEGGFVAWWRHQMETFSALQDICRGNSPVTGEFPAWRPVTRSFTVFFYLRLNKRLSKQWWAWWFETPLRPLWRHCYGSRALKKIEAGIQWHAFCRLHFHIYFPA